MEPESEHPSAIQDQNLSGQRFHPEKHSDHGEVIRDIIIGFADGLTVPFALTAGLSSYVIQGPQPPSLVMDMPC